MASGKLKSREETWENSLWGFGCAGIGVFLRTNLGVDWK